MVGSTVLKIFNVLSLPDAMCRTEHQIDLFGAHVLLRCRTAAVTKWMFTSATVMR